MNNEQRCVTVKEMADTLGICLRTARKLTASGEVPVIRIGRAVRVPVADLAAWMESKRVAGSA